MRYLKMPVKWQRWSNGQVWAAIDSDDLQDDYPDRVGEGPTDEAAFDALKQKLGYEEVLDKSTPSLSEEDVKELEWAITAAEKIKATRRANTLRSILNRFGGGKSAE